MSTLETIKRIIPTDTQTSQDVVANNWEKFIGTGKLNHKELRPVIANRWQRCRELAINPFKNRVHTVISEEEIKSKLHSENLGISGKNVLDRMSNSVEGTGHAIILADSSGRILYSVGQKDIRSNLEKINFRPGSDWNETVAGPNGIGTPLAIGQPEIVMGSEHYCRGWQPWVCYGAPIHNPNNSAILGCVDITGPADKVCIEAMALALSITQSIESELSVIQLKNREKLRLAYCDLQLKWPNEASLVVDEQGYIVDINSYANVLLNPSSTLINHSVHPLFPELVPYVDECFIVGAEKEFEIELQNTLMGSTRFLLRPIEIEGKPRGCFIMVVGGNNIITDFTSLRSNEDDLIRNTLIKTNNNISKAAKILNIDRTTIYRRRKNWQ
jgi:transcriptional regulator of acetoin/glycerol metabolism